MFIRGNTLDMTFTAFGQGVQQGGWVGGWVAGWLGGWVVLAETKDQQGLIKKLIGKFVSSFVYWQLN